MTVRVEVAPAMLEWARQRSGHDYEYLAQRFPKLDEWQSGEVAPTLSQLEDFARATYTPVGYFFLPDPPEDRLPIPDFRTIGDERLATPSPHLLDTIALCEERQAWYRDFMISRGDDPIDFVGSLDVSLPVGIAARRISARLGFEVEERRLIGSWTEALTALTARAEDAGVLVMISGVVGSNTHRKLDPQEFRGFALADSYAPLVFVNGTDTKAAQIFTLTHELVHLWLGQSAVSNTGLVQQHISSATTNSTERWCNSVAAEILVPRKALQQDFSPNAVLDDELRRLARSYKVSTLVVLKRLFDAKFLEWEQFHSIYEAELERALRRRESGGNFYNTTPVRVSKRFARAIINDTLEGRTLYRDAFRLLGFRTQSAFDGLGRTLGVM